MLGAMVFLIFWLPDQPMPTARFVKSFESYKECSEVVERINRTDAELKGKMTCLNVVATLPDAGKAF